MHGDQRKLAGLAPARPARWEPKGVYKHDDGRPMLGRKLKGKSEREMRDLGLAVDQS